LVKKEFGSFGFRYEEAVSILKTSVSVATNWNVVGNSATRRRLELRYQGYLEFQTIVLWDSDWIMGGTTEPGTYAFGNSGGHGSLRPGKCYEEIPIGLELVGSVRGRTEH
jgi:hypothetical protein